VKVIVPLGEYGLMRVEVEENPLRRFWTFAGWPGDPVEPRPYGGSRGIPVAGLRLSGGFCWLVAMELDGSGQLMTEHELFPCGDQEGAEAFFAAWVAAHAEEPELF